MYNRLGSGVCGCTHRRFAFTRQAAALFCVKWRHDCQLEIMTSNRTSNSVNRRIFTWRPICPISSWSDFKRGSLRLFWRGHHNKNKWRRKRRWVAIWDQFLIKQESCAIAKRTVRCTLYTPRTQNSCSKLVSPKFPHVPLGVAGWPLGYEERRCWSNCLCN